MKKFLLSMVAVLVAFAAGAWTVNFTNPDGWATVNIYAWDTNNGDAKCSGEWPGSPMTKSGDVWTYTGTGTPTKVIFNAGNSQPQTKDLSFKDGATYDLNGPIGVEITYSDIYVPVSEFDHTNCYIYAWSPNLFGGDPGTQMEKKTIDGKDYWVAKVNSEDLPVKVGGWKLHAGGWANQTSDLKGVTFQEGYVYYTNGTSAPLGEDPEPPVPGDVEVYLAGEFNSWNGSDDNYKFTKGEDNNYTLELASLSGNFKVVSDGSWLGTTTPVVSGVEYTLTDIGMANMALASKGTNVKLQFNPAQNILVATYEGEVTLPETLYLVGNICDWKVADGVACDTAQDGVYTWNSANLTAAEGTEYSYFIFAPSTDENESTRYGAPSKDKEISTTSPITLYTSDNSFCWMTKAHTYKVVADLKKMEVSITTTTGIEGVEVEDNVAAVYYNLQGVRVDAPANGLYIVVRGDKVAKEIVK